MQAIFFLSLCASFANSADYISYAFKNYVDPTTPPCENFYRHACKLGSPEYGFGDFIIEEMRKVTPNLEQFWKSLNIMKAITIFENKDLSNPKHLYEELCSKGEDTSVLLKKIEKLIEKTLGDCGGQSCFQYIQKDPNCSRGAEHIALITSDQLKLLRLNVVGIQIQLNITEKLITDISSHLLGNVTDGMIQTKIFLTMIKATAFEWIKETPWAKLNNVTESTIAALNPIFLDSDLKNVLKKSFDDLIKLEKDFNTCQAQFPMSDAASVFCLLETAAENDLIEDRIATFIDLGAFTAFPTISIGFGYYHLAQNSPSMAAKLGSTGFAVGHELAHTLVKSSPKDFLTFFSQTAKKCIQDQYAMTCETFKEESCDVRDYQFDENGADILGSQLAYSLLEAYYGDRLKEVYEPMGVTNQQLFFYATALQFCDGTLGRIIKTPDGKKDVHSADYVRINAIVAQHPGFKDAFQCSDNSEMMRSALDQCIVYGKNAPEIKKH